MSRISPEGRALLDAYREVREVEDRPDRAAFDRLERDIEPPVVQQPRRAAALVVGTVAAAAGVVAVLAVPRAPTRPEKAPAPVASAVDTTQEHTPTPATRSPQTSPLPTTTPPRPPVATLEPQRPPTRQVPDTPTSPPPSDDRLIEELALLRSVRAAMRRGEFDEAASGLQTHGQRFPKGQLAEDRDALWVVLRCRRGAKNTGREAFEAARPQSHHLPAIRAACAEKDQADDG